MEATSSATTVHEMQAFLPGWEMKEKCFIAVQIGCGYHAVSKEPEFNRLCAETCERATELLRAGRPAVEVVEFATMLLEDDPLTNAGIGSCLTRSGFVETDAGLMDGKSGLAGMVGAVRDVKNPVRVAKALLMEQLAYRTSDILLPASFLGGEGAYQYAVERGIDCYPKSTRPLESPMIVDEVRTRYNEYAERIARGRLEESPEAAARDTIGAVCIDMHGNAAASVSTGGRWMKPNGRIGDSAVIGGGFYARQDDDLVFACSATGIGEHLMQTLFCKSIYDTVKSVARDGTRTTALGDWMESFIAQIRTGEGIGGFVSLILDAESLEFWFGHTKHSLGLGYMGGGDRKATAIISRLPEGQKFRISGMSI